MGGGEYVDVPQQIDGGQKTTCESLLLLPCGTVLTSPNVAASALVFSAIHQSPFVLF